MAIVGPSIRPWPVGPQMPNFYLYNVRTLDPDGWFEALTPQLFRQTVQYSFDGDIRWTVRMIKAQYAVPLICNGRKKDILNRARVGGLGPGSGVSADYNFGGYSGYLGYSTTVKYWDGNVPKYTTITSTSLQGGIVPTHVTVDGQRFPVSSATVDAVASHTGKASCDSGFTSLKVAPRDLR